jgi:Beta/Gamma crystallin
MAEMRVFDNRWFCGQGGIFKQDLAHIRDFWNDKIISVKVVSGTWQVWEYPDFQGRTIILGQGEYPNLAINSRGIYNDTISSVRILSE